MSKATCDLTIDDLPPEIPLFPLSGALLLPDGRLPLNIFEQRYLAMVEDALGQDRFIGMIQPRQADRQTIGNGEPIYDVGCLGRMVAFAETDDGRYLITLEGLVRFKITQNLDVTKGYRNALVAYHGFENDFDRDRVEGFGRQPFIDALHAYFSLFQINGSWEALEKADEATLITSVAMAVPLNPEEKQAILESQTLADQGELLRSLMEMAVHEKQGVSTPVRH